MDNSETLFQELKTDLEHLAEPLFGASQMVIKKHGAFLPHAAVFTASGTVEIVVVGPDTLEHDVVSSIEVLASLHQALRRSASESRICAVAVCEDVRITLPGQIETRAIKVLVEHQRGLCIALYMPFRSKLFGYSFGDVFAAAAVPEVKPWPDIAAV